MINKKKRKKVKLIKGPKIQTIFCLISLIFIIGCCIFYGIRLVKYYRIYNPKAENGEVLANLATSIISNSSIVYEGEGLYINSGNYLYKGNDVNNYIIINDMLFRIMKINSDKTIDIVLDDYINKLKWDDEIKNFDDSYINTYLNEKFLNSLNKDLLVKTTVCSDIIKEIKNITCEESKNDDYVRLLGLNDYFNSMADEKTYLVKDNEFLWFYNRSNENVWHTTAKSVASSVSNKIYGIKPVVTLKNSVVLISGDGSLNNPYQIQEDDSNTIKIGTYLDINDDIYIVYEVGKDYYKVQSNKVLTNLIFHENTNEYADSSLKKYLEEEYLSNLNIDNLLETVFFDSIESKIGILSMEDLKFNSSLKNYFLTDQKDEEIYLYNGSLVSSKVNVKRNVRPCLGIKKEFDVISGNGTKLAPYIVEVDNA